METTDGYHTVEDRGNPNEIEHRGPFKCTRSNAWLGHGYYFWDDDLDRAHKWGIQAYGENGYVVCQTTIKILNFLDLCSKDGQKGFQALLMVLKEEMPEYRQEKIPIGKAIMHLRRIAQHPPFRDIFPYYATRSEDCPEDARIYFVAGRPEFTCMNPRVQICVYEKQHLLLHPLRIIFPDKYVE